MFSKQKWKTPAGVKFYSLGCKSQELNWLQRTNPVGVTHSYICRSFVPQGFTKMLDIISKPRCSVIASLGWYTPICERGRRPLNQTTPSFLPIRRLAALNRAHSSDRKTSKPQEKSQSMLETTELVIEKE